MADEIQISEIMCSINKLNRIQSIRWTEIPGSCEWDGFEHKPSHKPALAVTDIDGKEVTIEMHPPGDPLHGMDHAVVCVLVWLIQMEHTGDSRIPMGHIADMVNPCRHMMNAQENV